MSRQLRRTVRPLLIGTVVLCYPLLVYYSAGAPSGGELGAALAVFPVLAMALVLAWRSSQRYLLLGLFGLACALLAGAWDRLQQHFGWFYLLEHAGTNAALSLAFIYSLCGGREPVCSRFAALMGGPLSAEVAVYTRRVTVAWAAYFAIISAASGLLFFLLTLEAWTVFAYFLTPMLVVLMFVIEYGIRLLVFPRMQHVRFLDSVRTCWKSPAALSGRPH